MLASYRGGRLRQYITLPDQGFAFCCVPKVANSSVKWAILESLGFDPDADGLHTHPALHILTKPEFTERRRNFCTAAFVRNPFDRLVSCYAQKIRTWRCEKQGFAALGFRQDMSFREYLELVCRAPNANHHFMPQVHFLMHEGRPLFDFLGRLEHADADWRMMQRICDVNFKPLPRRNTSQHGYYRRYFTAETREMAEKTFEADLETFGYVY